MMSQPSPCGVALQMSVVVNQLAIQLVCVLCVCCVHECVHMCMQVCMCTLIGGLPPFPLSFLTGAVRQVRANWDSTATGRLCRATPEQAHGSQRMRSEKLSTEARAGKFYRL